MLLHRIKGCRQANGVFRSRLELELELGELRARSWKLAGGGRRCKHHSRNRYDGRTDEVESTEHDNRQQRRQRDVVVGGMGRKGDI